MRMSYIGAALACALLAITTIVSAQRPPAAEPPNLAATTEFRRSDPALLSATGRPQLVELFHPN